MGRTFEALRRAEEERRKKASDPADAILEAEVESPSLPAPAERNWFRFRKRPAASAHGNGNGTNGHANGTNGAFTANPLPHVSSAATVEEYQQLRKNLLAARSTRPLQLILLVASRHGEGVTTTSTMLGWAMANGGRCLLVDANFRTPGLSRIFNGADAPGLCEALADDPAQRRVHYLPTEIPNLWFMPTGRGPARIPYIFEGQKFDDLVSTLRREFDCILIDGAPMEMYADSSYIAPKTDGVILVVRAETTPVGSPSISLRELERVGAPVLGAVLNCTKTYIPRILQKLSNPQEVLEIAVLPSSNEVQK